MENKVSKTVAKYNMLKNGDTVVIGLSGGADSCALLHFLLSLREKMSLRLIACHVNHMLRGVEADRDETFVRELCKNNGVEFCLLKIDVAAEAKKRKVGTEQCGRDIRYAFFEETAKEFHAKIATAHTASDNAETVIFNLTRGCGMRGLGGIPPVRNNIIRPLIEVTREEIEEYCRTKGCDFVTDSTNLTKEYTRNKIRLDVIPVLKEINPSFEQTIAKMSERMRCEVDELYNHSCDILRSAQTDKGYKVKILNSSGDAVFSEIIRIICGEFDIIPTSAQVGIIRDICRTSGAVELKSKIYAVSNQGYLRIIKKSEEKNDGEVPYTGQETIVINNKKISLLSINIDEFHNREKINNLVFHSFLDYDTISSLSVFRCRKSGDSFRLPKRNVTKTVKRLFNEMKIPRDERDSVVMLASGSEILWIDGIGVSADHTVTDKTKKVLMITIE